MLKKREEDQPRAPPSCVRWTPSRAAYRRQAGHPRASNGLNLAMLRPEGGRPTAAQRAWQLLSTDPGAVSILEEALLSSVLAMRGVLRLPVTYARTTKGLHQYRYT